MNRLTRDETAEPISRDQIIRREKGQGNTDCSVPLTSSRIDSLVRLILALAICVTIHTTCRRRKKILCRVRLPTNKLVKVLRSIIATASKPARWIHQSENRITQPREYVRHLILVTLTLFTIRPTRFLWLLVMVCLCS